MGPTTALASRSKPHSPACPLTDRLRLWTHTTLCERGPHRLTAPLGGNFEQHGITVDYSARTVYFHLHVTGMYFKHGEPMVERGRTMPVTPISIRAYTQRHEAEDDLRLHLSDPSRAKDASTMAERHARIFSTRNEEQKRSGSGPIHQNMVCAYTEDGLSLDAPCMQPDQHILSGRTAPAGSRVTTHSACRACGTVEDGCSP